MPKRWALGEFQPRWLFKVEHLSCEMSCNESKISTMDSRRSDPLVDAPVCGKPTIKNSTHHKATMVNRPTASFIYERPPYRAAAAPQSTSSADSATCLVAAQRSSAARGLRLVTLLLWHRVFALYEVGYGNTPSISQMSVLEIEPHMDRISLGIGVNEQRGGEAVDLSNR